MWLVMEQKKEYIIPFKSLLNIHSKIDTAFASEIIKNSLQTRSRFGVWPRSHFSSRAVISSSGLHVWVAIGNRIDRQ